MLMETGALISLQANASKIVPFLDSAEPQLDCGFRLFDVTGQLVREMPFSAAQFGANRVLYHWQDLHFAL
jgi:salicylate hydroxylase